MEFTSTTLDSCGPRRHHSVVFGLTFSLTSGTWEPLGSCEIWADAVAAAVEVVAARETAPVPGAGRRLLGSATEEEDEEEGAEDEEDEEEEEVEVEGEGEE